MLSTRPRSRRNSVVNLHAVGKQLTGQETVLLKEALEAQQKTEQSSILQNFTRRECFRFVPVSTKEPKRCGCGRSDDKHGPDSEWPTDTNDNIRSWSIQRNTRALPTDAYGTIEFQGGPHPHKAQYVRLGFDSEPERIFELFTKAWGIKPPKLVITVHGGMADFNLTPKVSKAFRTGLMKAAKTTGAWIITSGINSGVVKQVASAITQEGGHSKSKRSKVVTIGITPWGLLKKSEELIAKSSNELPKSVPYHPQAFSPKGTLAVLNDRHSFFLLVDNGTVSRYGADIILRKRFEEYLSSQYIVDGSQSTGGGKRTKMKTIPVVCVVLEGGTCTIKSVLDYVTNIPPVPVVVCAGSGRAADLLSYVHGATDAGRMSETERKIVATRVANMFQYTPEQADRVVIEMQYCARKKELLTIFKVGEEQDVDHAILTALLKGQRLTAPDQLSLTLTWDRADIAKKDIFILGQDWPPHSLEEIMMHALILDRVDFVKLLLANGVSMEKFLTVHRLEELYNHESTKSTLKNIILDVKPDNKTNSITLPLIGMCMKKLMGGTYTSTYSTKGFKQSYDNIVSKYNEQTLRRHPSRIRQAAVSSGSLSQHPWRTLVDISPLIQERAHKIEEHIKTELDRLKKKHQEKDKSKVRADTTDKSEESEEDVRPHFDYPFNELLVWAVLSNRQSMAKCMWSHGEEALAKALVASKLYKSLADEAAEDYVEEEVCRELKKNSDEFTHCSLELLEGCYMADKEITRNLLMYELTNWGKQTCLTLAVLAHHKEFLAHPGCQILLADLWNGGLRIRKYVSFKVIAGVVCPPYIFFLDFKNKDELKNQPQTASEHAADTGFNPESDSSVGSDDDDFSEDEDMDVGALVDDGHAMENGRKKSGGSIRSGSSNNSGTFMNWLRAKSPRARTVTNRSVSANEHQGRYANGVIGRFLSVDASGPSPAMLSPSRRPRTSTTTQRRTSGDVTGPRTLFMSEISRKNTHPNFTRTDETRMDAGLDAPVDTQPHLNNGKAWRNSLPNVSLYPRNPFAPRKPDEDGSKELGIKKRLSEFYRAPITTFWTSAMTYVAFLVCFTYITLVRTPPHLNAAEIYVIIYVLSLLFDSFRKILTAEPVGFVSKVHVFCERSWNVMTLMSCIVFMVGFGLRLSPQTISAGRLIYCINVMYWYIRLLEILSVFSTLGPYITMVKQMVLKMVYICLILLVLLTAFGLSRQAILFPYEDWHWMLVRNIFYKPYFMLYGEVYAGEIDECGDRGERCEYGAWLTPLFMSIFLLLANILLINLLIAVFNNIFMETSAISTQLWKFQRYAQVMEYESASAWPPPLNMIAHLCLIYQYFVKRRHAKNKKKFTIDYALKMFLGMDEVDKIHDFEEEVMEDMARQKEVEYCNTQTEIIRRIAEHNEVNAQRMYDFKTEVLSKPTSVNRPMEGLMPEKLDCGCENKYSALEEKLDIVLKLLNQQNGITNRINQLGYSESSTLSARRAERAILPPLLQLPIPVANVANVANVPRAAAGQDAVISETTEVRIPLISVSTYNDAHSILPQPTHEPDFSDTVLRVNPPPIRFHFHSDNSSDSSTNTSPFPRAAKSKVTTPTSARRVRSLPLESQITGNAPLSPPFTPGYTNHSFTHQKSPLYDSSHNSETQVMNRAKPSFMRTHRETMREYEETGSRIAGGLMEGCRARRESVYLTRPEDLKEMGFPDPDIDLYLQVLNRDHSSLSSSQDSLSSNRIENAEGFHQISECLIDQEQSRAGGQGVNSAYSTDSVYSPPSTICGTPLTSPMAKASQVFSFDKATLDEYMRKFEDDETTLLLCDEEE